MAWIWCLLFSVWATDVQEIPSSGTPPISNKASCLVYNTSQVVYTFGGHVGNDKLLDEIFVFDLKTRLWEEMTPLSPIKPAKRFGSGCFIKNQYVFVFGGTTVYGTDTDLWAYDTIKNKWEEIKNDESPTYRFSFAHTSFIRNENRYFAVYGGFNETGICSGLYM